MHRNWIRLLAAIACAGGLTPVLVRAQVPTVAKSAGSSAPAFDVVSIREDQQPRSGPPVYGPTVTGYRMQNLPMALVVMAAYAPSGGDANSFFRPDDILGMPDWMTQVRYDVDARVAESDLTRWQNPAEQPALAHAMLQQMLTERLKMAVHREEKEKPVFELRAGKDMSKLKPSAGKDLNGVREQHPSAGQMPGGIIMAEGEGHALMIYNVTMSGLGTLLAQAVGRPVVDKTGLIGSYDITLELDMSAGPGGEQPNKAVVIASAVQEQLGLKLEPAKEQVEVLVIDHMERPTEN